MKKALWTPATKRLVQDSIDGLVAAVPHLRRIDGFPEVKVVVDGTHDSSKVACISGGGSGHEPAHAGFVGSGMLAAAVCGEVFASPSAEAVLAAIHAVAPSPALLIVKNYTGDRINFGLAAEQAKATGLQVDMVVVGDDTAIDAPGLAGRRGLAGTAYVHKVAGAAAAAGASLSEVAHVARGAAASIASLGVALNVCTPPGSPPSTRLGSEDIEIGLGIHGEPGYETCRWQPLEELVPRMMRRILGYQGGETKAAFMNQHTPLALMVNNLGGTSNLEMHAVANEALGWLAHEGHDVRRLHTGAVVTSLDMAGVSLTLMACDDARLAALDAPTTAPGWPACGGPLVRGGKALLPLPPAVMEVRERRKRLLLGRSLAAATPEGRTVEAAVRAAAVALQKVARRLDELDAFAGDGDCGSTCALAANALLAAPEGAFSGPDGLYAVAAAVRGAVGGSLGGLYNLGLTAAAGALEPRPADDAVGPAGWAAAMVAGVRAVERYGLARAGSRTMLDALLPAARALTEAAAKGAGAAEAARAAALAAAAGADATKGMAATAGRASYTRGTALSDADPGAVAVATWLDAVATAIVDQQSHTAQ